MSTPYDRAPHIEGPQTPAHPSHAPNAALLVDFDNVTMGMRSDLSKELKALLNSDIIKGKVTVQRAYADWRRYPQYIVPLSEASVDLIFAPAYGSSKKNATDIRMAIDGMELVFTRPEIGTYILLTGDSDFSSLVLKLKEYGKYVIGVGIQESSSDILVQNCDEYYSYTSISGLRKTSDGTGGPTQDPWVLVEKAVEQMVKRSDVMRSDRLKQVMLEIDPGFEEKSFGFSKFSRFLTEAAQRGLLQIRKMENGQYEVVPNRGGGAASPSTPSPSRSSDRNGRGRSGRRDDSRRSESRKDDSAPREKDKPTADRSSAGTSAASGDALNAAYDLLHEAIEDLLDDHEGSTVRDSDVKRRMLAIKSSFDEAELGFSKFSRFLRQADDDKKVTLQKGDNGQYQVGIPEGGRKPTQETSRKTEPPAPSPSKVEKDKPAPRPSAKKDSRPDDDGAKPGAEPKTTRKEAAAASKGDSGVRDSRRLRPRLSSRRRGAKDEPPPLLEGQVVGTPASRSKASSKKSQDEKDTGSGKKAPSDRKAGEKKTTTRKAAEKKPPAKKTGKGKATRKEPAADQSKAKASGPKKPAGSGKQEAGSQGVLEPSALNLPRGRASVIKYLSNSYAGVGKKTAETLVDELGDELFQVLQTDPKRIQKVLPPARAEKVLDAWKEDLARRRSRLESGEGSGGRSSR